MTIAADPMPSTHQAHNSAAVAKLAERLARAAAGLSSAPQEKQLVMRIEVLQRRIGRQSATSSTTTSDEPKAAIPCRLIASSLPR